MIGLMHGNLNKLFENDINISMKFLFLAMVDVWESYKIL
jgi:hypothetical protein